MTMKSKMPRLLVDYDGVGDFGEAEAEAAELENVIAVVIDNVAMSENLDEETIVNSNLWKKDVGVHSTGGVNARVKVHMFVSDRQMNDWRH